MPAAAADDAAPSAAPSAADAPEPRPRAETAITAAATDNEPAARSAAPAAAGATPAAHDQQRADAQHWQIPIPDSATNAATGLPIPIASDCP